MTTRKITLSIPETMLAEAQTLAAARGADVQTLVVEGLVRLTDGAYEEARARQQTLMRAARRLREEGEPFSPRDALHER